MPTYRLTLEYQGTRYAGWQEQRNARTVAGELRAALGRATGQRVVDLGGAGRTDAGVHAVGQAAHARLAEPVDPVAVRDAINDELPSDVHVLALEPADDRFHARHDAIARSYVYQVCRRRTAFARRHVWWVKRAIDTARLAAAAELLHGSHDFAPFADLEPEDTNSRVTIDDVQVVEEGALILVRVTASHFLRRMVRRLVGALARVGTGEWNADDVAGLLAGKGLHASRGTVAETTAPAMGLYLERVFYRGDTTIGPLVAPFPVPAEPASTLATARRPPRRSPRKER